MQLWIDVLEREGLLAEEQLAAADIPLVTDDDAAVTNWWARLR